MKLQTTEQQRVRIYTVPKVADRLTELFDCTVFPGRGSWRGADGVVYDEDSATVEVLVADDDAADTVVGHSADIAHQLGEEAILVTVESVQARMLATDQAYLESIK